MINLLWVTLCLFTVDTAQKKHWHYLKENFDAEISKIPFQMLFLIKTRTADYNACLP